MTEETLFAAALEKGTPAERDAFLAEACAGDEALRRRLEALLESHQNAEFLREPAFERAVEAFGGEPTLGMSDQASVAEPAMTDRTGTVVGPYKLLQKIGEGGMGTVYMAEQTQPVRRTVAVKLIKAGMDSRQVLARFGAERQALALMDHPNIAKVLDAGATDQERPYFVMELVQGTPITHYCDEHHLTPKERLELFLPVCAAVQHAHQKGIIHRDLKPSNVLVGLYDGKPVPKIIDFGVAKAVGQKLTEHTLFTGLGAVIGTPEYMSPEQAQLGNDDIDTRADIYSIGILLYELLTGTTPLQNNRVRQAAVLEVLRLIREEEPPKPSSRLSTTDELPSIAANRNMEPRRLAGVVQGDLDWIVMKALEKDRGRRYETANGFASDIRRYLAEEPVLACPPSAVYRLRKFVRRNKVSIAFTGLVLLVLLAVTGGIGWNLRDRAARQTAVEREARLALKEAEQWRDQARWPEAMSAAKRAEGVLAGGGGDELRKRAQQLHGDLEMVVRLEGIRLLSSEWTNDKFDHETADRAYAQAFADYGIAIAGLSPEDAAARILERGEVAAALTAALDDWAYSRSLTDKEGARPLRAIVQIADPDPWRRQVRQARKEKDTKAEATLAASPELQRQPPTSLLLLARTMWGGGNLETAIEVLRQAQRQYPGDFWINFELANALPDSNRDERVSFLRAALAVRPQSIAARNELGLALRDQGKLDEAIACFRTAIELDPQFLNGHINLGETLKIQGKLDEAIAACRAAIALIPKSAPIHTILGRVLTAQGKPDDATAACRRAIELDPKFAAAHINLGIGLRDQGKLDEAIAAYRKAIELDPKSVDGHCSLGVALLSQGKHVEAIAANRKALELDPNSATAQNNLGCALLDQKNWDEAVAAFHKVIELDPKSAPAHSNLGNGLKGQGKLDEAIAAYQKAIELDPKFAVGHRGLGLALKSQAKLDEAIVAFRTAVEIDPNSAKAQIDLGCALSDQKQMDEALIAFRAAVQLDPQSVDGHRHLGTALERLGKVDEAIAAYRKAIEIDPDFTRGYTELGRALTAKGMLDEAIAAYRKAIEIDPRVTKAYNNLGVALGSQGKWDEAIAAYREAIDIDPTYTIAQMNLGYALKAQGKMDEAIETFRKAIELEPKRASLHLELGLIFQQKRNLPEAIEAYRKAIELDPNYAMAYNNMGVALKAQRKFTESDSHFRKAIELEPKHRLAHGNLAQSLLDQGQFGEAIAALYNAIESDPTSASFHPNLAFYLDRQGKFDEAIAVDRAAIALEPHNAMHYANMGTTLANLSRWDESVAAHRRAIELEPDEAAHHTRLGHALKGLGRCDEAAVAYRKAIEIDPNDVKAHGGLGNALREQGKLDEAIAAYRKAVELDTKNVTTHGNLGHVLMQQGKPDEAFAAYQEALELDPNSVSALGGLGNALKEQGKLDEAIAAYLRAIELDPNFAKGYRDLGLALSVQDKLDEAIAAYRKAIELEPKNFFGLKGLSYALSTKAWSLANHPDQNLRDPQLAAELGNEAVALAKVWVELDPRSPEAWQRLGWIEYRAGNWPASIEALETSSKLQDGGTGDPYQWLYMAMAHARLGRNEEARKWYDKTIELEKYWPEDLRRFRAEAEELLGVNAEKK